MRSQQSHPHTLEASQLEARVAHFDMTRRHLSLSAEKTLGTGGQGAALSSAASLGAGGDAVLGGVDLASCSVCQSPVCRPKTGEDGKGGSACV